MIKAIPLTKIFPTVLIILDICAAMGYVPTHDWRRIIYWIAAAILTTTVTF